MTTEKKELKRNGRETERHTEIDVGDTVYIKATVTRIPGERSNLYRLITSGEGTVIWCTPEEIVE